MNPELFRTLFLQDLISLRDLFCSHSIFCISRIVHDIIADLKQSARVIPAADRLRDMADRLLKEIDVRDIIQIDDRAQPVRQLEVLSRCVIGRKHNIFTGHTNRL